MLLLGGRYALCWKPPFCLAFHEMDRKSREAMLLSWKESAILKPVRLILPETHVLQINLLVCMP